ncbi:MAG: TonB-dependent receptor [Melioribacteraceae bacterium]|nr:TonB-dependent receptor [Melioribacteraceae bacterium]
MIRIFLLLIFVLMNINAQQHSLRGFIYDENENPLIGANIIIKGTVYGTSTNNDGYFSFENLELPKVIVEVSMIGFVKFTSEELDLTENSELEITLTQSDYELNEVIVTAGKYKQSIKDLPVSAEVLSAEFLNKKNIVKFDDALRYVPGVQVTLDQVSIRGSSGYSRGAGTRVLTAIDGIPLYTGDTGEIIWEIIPVLDLERVEVVKGAASSIYGSTAIGGVINVITKDIPNKSLISVTTYLGAYDKPSFSQWDWSNKYRTFNGISVSHTNSITEKLGVSFSLSRKEDLSYRQGGWFHRYSGYLKSKYNFDENTSLTLLATGYNQIRGNFNFWKNLNNALVPPDGDQGITVPSERYIIGLSLNKRLDNKFSYKITGSWYRSIWSDQSESDNSSNSNLFRGEVQTDWNISESLKLISGTELLWGEVNSNIFGNPNSSSLGFYSQLEFQLNRQIKLFSGLRYDLNKLDTLKSENSVSPKIGINYQPTETTTIRASFGKGFRAPSLAEAFTSTITSGLVVRPNPQIKPEYNYSYEFGINQIILKNISIDAAFFQNDYFHMIEPAFEPGGQFVIFDNITKARIQGTELNIKTDIELINSMFSINHTYLWARDLINNKALKYRPRNLIYLSLETNFNYFETRIDFRYWSRAEEIDDQLSRVVADAQSRVEVFVTDISLGANLFQIGIPGRINFVLNNIFNYNYVEMIGNISPIRNISVNLDLLF